MPKVYSEKQNAWIENTPKIYSEKMSAMVEAPNAKVYVESQNAWVDTLKSAVRFGWAYSTGTNDPEYEYQPNGTSAFVKSIVTSDGSRTDVVLRVKAPKITSSAYLINVNVSDAGGGSNLSSAIAFGYITTVGNVVHVSATDYAYVVSDKKASASIDLSEDIDSLYICIQDYGNTGSYFECVLSDLTINGVAYDFK